MGVVDIKPLSGVGGVGGMANAQVRAQELALASRQFELEKFGTAFKLMQSSSPESMRAALPGLNAKAQELFPGIPIDLTTNLDVVSEGFRQFEMLSQDPTKSPEDRSRLANNILFTIGQATSPLDEETMAEAKRQHLEAAFPYTQVTALSGQDVRNTQLDAVGAFVDQRAAEIQSSGLVDLDEARFLARQEAQKQGLFSGLVDEGNARLPIPGDSPEFLLQMDQFEKEQNTLAALSILPEEERTKALVALLGNHANLPSDDPKVVEARNMVKIVELASKGGKRTAQEQGEFIDRLRLIPGAVEQFTQMDELDRAKITKMQSEVKLNVEQAQRVQADALKIQEVTAGFKAKRAVFDEQTQLQMDQLRAQTEILKEKKTKTQAETNQIQQNTARLKALTDQVGFTNEEIQASTDQIKVQIEAQKQAITQAKAIGPLEVEKRKIGLSILESQLRLNDLTAEFKEKANPKLLNKIDKELGVMDADIRRMNALSVKYLKEAEKGQSSLDDVRQSLIDRRKFLTDEPRNTNIASFLFAGLPEAQRNAQGLNKAITDAGLDPATVDTNSILNSQVGKNVNIKTLGTTGNLTATNQRIFATRQAKPIVKELIRLAVENPDMFQASGAVRGLFFTGASTLKSTFDLMFGSPESAVELSESYPVEDAARDIVDQYANQIFDPNAANFDTLQGILVYTIARVLDDNGRLGVDDVKRAERVVGQRNFLTSQPEIIQKLQTLDGFLDGRLSGALTDRAEILSPRTGGGGGIDINALADEVLAN